MGAALNLASPFKRDIVLAVKPDLPDIRVSRIDFIFRFDADDILQHVTTIICGLLIV